MSLPGEPSAFEAEGGGERSDAESSSSTVSMILRRRDDVGASPRAQRESSLRNLDYVLMRDAPPTRQTRRTHDRQALSARRTRRPQGTS